MTLRLALFLSLSTTLAPWATSAQSPERPPTNDAADGGAAPGGVDDDGNGSEPTEPTEPTDGPTAAEPPSEAAPTTTLEDVPPPPRAAPTVGAADAAPPQARDWTVGQWFVGAGGYQAAAFVLSDPRVLVTSSSAMRNRGPVRAWNPETDVEVPVELIAIDDESGLALVRAEVELEAPRPTGPAPRLGDRVMHVGTAPTSTGRGGGERWSLVLATRGHHLALASICQTGTPLFDVDGRLVAVCTGSDRALAVDALTERATPAAEPISRSAWRGRFSFDLRYRVQPDYEGALNGELGFGVLGWDRLGFMLRGGIAGGADERGNTGVRLRARLEITGEVQLHHAFRAFNVPMRFVLGAGAVFRAQERRVTETFAELEPGCDPAMGPCAILLDEQTTVTNRYRVLPSARVELNLGGLALSYTVALDYDEWRASTHSLGVGFVF